MAERFRTHVLALLLCWMFVCVFTASEAFAQSAVPSAPAAATSAPPASLPISTTPLLPPPAVDVPSVPLATLCPGPGVTARLAGCTKRTVINATKSYFGLINAALSDAVTAAMTLAVVLFGILTLTGTITPNRDTTILLLKIGVITAFLANMGYFFTLLLDAMEGLLEIVARAVPVRATAVCGKEVDEFIVWHRMDCMLNRVIGITPGVFLTAGMFGLITAALFSQKVGLAIAALGVMVIVMLLLAVGRALYVYVMAYAGLGLMVVLSPIFLTMMLFQQTKPMFDKWAKMCMGFVLQPFFLFAYLMVMLTAYDITIFSGEDSFYRTLAGDESLAPDFQLNSWLISHNVYKDSFQFGSMFDVNPGEVGAPEQTAYLGVPGQVTEYLEQTGEQIARQSSVKIGAPVKIIDLQRLADLKTARENPAKPYTAGQMANAIILSLLAAVLAGYILYSLLGYIPAMGYDLASGAAGTLNLSQGFTQIQRLISGSISRPFGGGGKS